MTSALLMAFNVLLRAERALSATDVMVRLPVPYSNTHLLLTTLRRQKCIAEVFRLGNQKFFAPVANAPPPVVDEARTIAATQAALTVRRKHKFAMLAREARRRG